MDSSLRYFGCAVGFGFGLVWMTVGLGPAILCVLLAGVGYGAVFVAERARAEAAARGVPADGFESDFERYEVDRPDDTTSPLSADADYGWPVEHHELAHSETR